MIRRSIKKYFPLAALAFVLTMTFTGRAMIQFVESTAKQKVGKNDLAKYYENAFKSVAFKAQDGKIIGEKSQRAPVTIVNFWASWCTPCLEEFPSLIKLREKYSAKQVAIYGVNTDSDEQEMKKAILKNKLNFDIVPDLFGEITEKFMIEAIPVTIIFRGEKFWKESKGAEDFMAEQFLESLEEKIRGKP